MDGQIEEITYHSTMVPGGATEAARIVKAIFDSGVSLLAFSAAHRGNGLYQLDIVPENDDLFRDTLDLGEKKAIFAIHTDTQGDLSSLLKRLSDADIQVQTILGGSYLAVAPADVRKAALVLDAKGCRSQISDDVVDQASEESFPASDPPSFNAGKAESVT